MHGTNVTGIDHYNLRASRETLEALRVFYCDIVGLSVFVVAMVEA